MKNIIIKLLFVFLFISCSCTHEGPTVVVKDTDPDSNSGKITDSFKKNISDEYNTDTFKFGATLNFY